MNSTFLGKKLPPLRIEHPFTVLNAIIMASATGIILTGILQIDNLRFGDIVPFSTEQMIFSLIHLLLITFLLFFYCFYIFRHATAGGLASLTQSATSCFVWAIAGSLVIAFVYSLLSRWLRIYIFPSWGINTLLDISMVKDGFVALTVILITLLLFNITRRQQLVLEKEHIQAENIRTRYDALENQVDPHFLFNSLNTLDGLIGVDDDRAHRYLQQLALSYRYIMQQQKQVTLADELAFADNYIAMMQIRHGDNFRVERHIDPACLNHLVVPISVQLLLENAIKHNVVSDRYPLTVTLRNTDHHTLLISNPIHAKCDPDSQSSGIGLANLSQRYQLLFHKDILVSSAEGTFSVEIPLICDL